MAVLRAMLRPRGYKSVKLRSICFRFRAGVYPVLSPPDVVPGFAKEVGAMAVVTDMCPLRDPTRRAHEVAEGLTKAGHGLPLFQVKRLFFDNRPCVNPLIFPHRARRGRTSGRGRREQQFFCV